MSTLTADLRRASRQLVREWGFLQQRCGPAPATHAQAHALIEVGLAGRLTVAELAVVLGLDKSSASRTVAGLARKRWIRAARGGADRRTKPVALTAQGEAVLRGIHAAADAQVAAALAQLDGAEQPAVLAGMQRYADALTRARTLAAYRFRPIRKADDPAVAALIRRTMTEFSAVGAGYSINDPEVDRMTSAYRGPRSAYWVIEHDGRIVGGGGTGPLAGGPTGTCELRKMYFLPETRGLGLGRALLTRILDFARAAGYTHCYLETLQRMHQARRLYEAAGFQRAATPRGATGHFGCDAWYQRDL